MSRDFEFYETPESHIAALCRELTRHEITPASLGRDWYEPCVGHQAIVRGITRHWPYDRLWRLDDLDPRWTGPFPTRDATKCDTWDALAPIDTVITNPPFSAALAIASHALAHARRAVMLYLRVSFHEVLKEGPRRSWLREHPPTGLVFLPRFAYRRSPTTLKWTTDSMSACWTIWMTGARDQWIAYADEACLADQETETPGYRERMDRLMDVQSVPS